MSAAVFDIFGQVWTDGVPCFGNNLNALWNGEGKQFVLRNAVPLNMTSDSAELDVSRRDMAGLDLSWT